MGINLLKMSEYSDSDIKKYPSYVAQTIFEHICSLKSSYIRIHHHSDHFGLFFYSIRCSYPQITIIIWFETNSPMCKSKRTYIPVAMAYRSYRLYMDDLKSIHKIIKKKTPRVPSFDCPSPKPDEYTDEELEF